MVGLNGNMRPISKKLREIIDTDPYYRKCLRHKEGNCQSRVTIEHCYIYAGSQIDELWNLIPLCVYHHLGHGLNKKMNHWFAVNRMTEEDMQKYPRFDWKREKIILNRLFKM